MTMLDADRPTEEPRSNLTAVGKALTLLDAFGAGTATLSLTDLATRTGLSKTTAFRLLGDLVEHGYVERRGNQYSVGRKVFELGNAVPHCRPRGLRDVALPYLSELYEKTHNVVHLAVLTGTDVLYLEKLYGHNPVRSPSHVGGRIPAACCGLGKAILAFSEPDVVQAVIVEGLKPRTPYSIHSVPNFLAELDAVRARGVAFDREEVVLGLSCVAAPVLKRGVPVAAISMSATPSRMESESMEAMVRKAAAAIAQQLR